MKTNLRNNMTRNLVTINKHAHAGDAYKIMSAHMIRHLPVVDDTGEFIVGMLSDRDLLRSPHPVTPVYELMSSPVRTFDVETPLRLVVQAMIDEKISAFIITGKEDIMGIVTTEDMLILLSKILQDEDSSKWVLNEFLVNPVFQRAVNMTTQAGI
jgi:CBS domain-containing protein